MPGRRCRPDASGHAANTRLAHVDAVDLEAAFGDALAEVAVSAADVKDGPRARRGQIRHDFVQIQRLVRGIRVLIEVVVCVLVIGHAPSVLPSRSGSGLPQRQSEAVLRLGVLATDVGLENMEGSTRESRAHSDATVGEVSMRLAPGARAGGGELTESMWVTLNQILFSSCQRRRYCLRRPFRFRARCRHGLRRLCRGVDRDHVLPGLRHHGSLAPSPRRDPLCWRLARGVPGARVNRRARPHPVRRCSGSGSATTRQRQRSPLFSGLLPCSLPTSFCQMTVAFSRRTMSTIGVGLYLVGVVLSANHANTVSASRPISPGCLRSR